MLKTASDGVSESKRVVGLLLSGGLDSAILLGFLLRRGARVQPFYIDCGLIWQRAELRALRRFLSAMAESNLLPLVVLSFPLDDVYGQHWSITGCAIPAASTSDQAVFLPCRNVFLVIKAALWCQLHGIQELALATLISNPFPDASLRFFEKFQSALQIALCQEFRIIRPFGQYHKQQVMDLGRNLPLELTFSCVSPIDGEHCGACNKCAERQAAFRIAGMHDLTAYATNSICVH
ncbi:MAG: ExsB family protein [Planctomycetaceae bacterium]|nr:ExsB family protein [Planctomycetaceae bacterium]